MIAPGNADCVPSGTPICNQGEEAHKRFRIGCMMLRFSSQLDFKDLPPPRQSESVIDWLVRAGISQTPQQALEGLLLASGPRVVQMRDELAADPSVDL